MPFFVRYLAFVFTLSQLSAAPNFVIINIDDLGYADTGPYGSTLNRTPNLDRMAAEGMKLTSHYASPVCTPSRASSSLAVLTNPAIFNPDPTLLYELTEPTKLLAQAAMLGNTEQERLQAADLRNQADQLLKDLRQRHDRALNEFYQNEV